MRYFFDFDGEHPDQQGVDLPDMREASGYMSSVHGDDAPEVAPTAL